ncbi:MAG: EamA family transporter RarD [Moraxella sp.]|nr:MAG: EamA family transporter RarD [Moraxella sp.]
MSVKTTPNGLICALTAFLIWGIFPLYFKELSDYSASEVIVHRIIWTFVVLLFVMIVGRRTQWLAMMRQHPRWLAFAFLASLLIASNWLIYVWAVAHNQILEASLGYFINPLFGVLLSVILFGERLRTFQKIAVALATAAILIQILWLGGLSWISLLLPLSFGIYGVIQRQTPFNAIDGLFLETLLLVPLCLGWLLTTDVKSSHLDFWFSYDIWLLTLAGPITLIPLLLYNQATRWVAFNTLSFLNYLTPSIVFLLAIFYYHEGFDIKKLLVFSLIWLGLIIYSIDLIKHKS